MATVARLTDELGGQCFLVTGDKDCRQLITDRVKLYNIRKNEVFDRELLRREWGVAPHQVVDFQALVGDSTDNVPGVPLIGPKAARQLLEKYGTLEGILEHVDEVSGAAKKENLMKYREQALLSRKLVRLEAHVPLAIDWKAARPDGGDHARALALFEEFGFRRLAERLPAIRDAVTQAEGTAEGRTSRSIPRSTRPRPSPRLSTNCGSKSRSRSIRKRPRLAALGRNRRHVARLERAGGVVLAACAARRAAVARSPTTLAALRPMLEDPAIEKVGQNLKYDRIVLRDAGIELAGTPFDTMVASYLLDAGQRNHNLDDLAKRYLHHVTIKIEELIGAGKQQKRMDEVPVPQIADYAAEDAWCRCGCSRSSRGGWKRIA